MAVNTARVQDATGPTDYNQASVKTIVMLPTVDTRMKFGEIISSGLVSDRLVDNAYSVDMKEVGETIQSIKNDWKEKKFSSTVNHCRKLLEWEPGNLYGLIYLARAAAHTGEWSEVAEAGLSLVRNSPRDAFIAARKINRAGRALDAARIFAELNILEDWFDSELRELARGEGALLLRAGQAAETAGDQDLALTLWVAGARIAPANELLAERIRRLSDVALRQAKSLDRDADIIAYRDAWLAVLRLAPSNVTAAVKFASAQERLDQKQGVEAWLKVLAIAPDHDVAIERVRLLAMRHDMEERAIRGLIDLDRDEQSDPLIGALAKSRDIKARESHGRTLKLRLREALQAARVVDLQIDPRKYLAAWKDVIVLDPTNIGAAKKVVRAARQLGDHSEVVEGLIALLMITPDEGTLRENLISAARRAGREEHALNFLADHNLEQLPEEKVEGLRKRVRSACKNALKASDLDVALINFRTLARVDRAHHSFESLRTSVIKRAVSSAGEAERDGNLAVAIPLAEQVLEIVPDHPVALKIVARDLLRHRRFHDLVVLCQPRIKPGPEYRSLQKLLDRALEKLGS